MAKAYYWNDKIWNNTGTGSGAWGMRISNFRASGTSIVSTTGATLFPATFAAGDIIYFGTSPYYGRTFRNIYFDIGTAMAGTYTLAWEYYNGNAWTALTVTDGTTNFTTTGVNSVDFTPPTDWQMVNPSSLGTGYWVRCRIATCTVSTTNPVMTAGVYIKFGNNTFAFTGDTAGTDDVTFDDIFNNAGTAPITRLTTDTIGRRAYRFDCHLAYSRMAVNGGTADNKAGFLNDSNVDIHFGNECRLFSYNTSSAMTLGKAWSAGVAGYQGCTVRYNRYTYTSTQAVRIDDDCNGTVKLYNCLFASLEDGANLTSAIYNMSSIFFSNASNSSSEYLDCTFENLNFVDLQGTGNKKRLSFYNVFQPQVGGGGTIDDFKSINNYCNFGTFQQSHTDLTLTNLRASGNTTRAINTYNMRNTGYLVNPSYTRPTNSSPNQMNWGFGDRGKFLEQYKVDIHVQDEAGNAIPNATVAMKPDSTAPVTTLEESNNFSVTTDASGNITQQTLTSAKIECLYTTLTSDMAAGDTTINVASTTNFLSGGTRYIYFPNDEARSYTGLTATTLTGSAHYIGPNTGQTSGTKCISTNGQTVSIISDYGPFIITVTKPGFKTMRLRKLAVLSATYGLKGLVLTVVLPRENVNLAPEVITLS